MAFYNPDYRLIEAQKVIDDLSELDEKGALIKYYIDYLLGKIDAKNEQIEKYQKIFDMMSEFLPISGVSRRLI